MKNKVTLCRQKLAVYIIYNSILEGVTDNPPDDKRQEARAKLQLKHQPGRVPRKGLQAVVERTHRGDYIYCTDFLLLTWFGL